MTQPHEVLVGLTETEARALHDMLDHDLAGHHNRMEDNLRRAGVDTNPAQGYLESAIRNAEAAYVTRRIRAAVNRGLCIYETVVS